MFALARVVRISQFLFHVQILPHTNLLTGALIKANGRGFRASCQVTKTNGKRNCAKHQSADANDDFCHYDLRQASFLYFLWRTCAAITRLRLVSFVRHF